MKTIFPKLITVGVLLLPLTTATEAAFNPAVVSADAKWIVHLDVNNLRDGALGQELTNFLVQLQPAMDQGGVHPDFKKILATANAITAYGTNFSQDPKEVAGTIIVQGTDDLRKIAEAFVTQATITHPEAITELKGLPFEAYSLNGQATLAFPKEPVILFSKSQEQLAKAYEVFRGSAPSMAKASSPLSALLPKTGNYFLIAASLVPSADGLPGQLQSGPQARILQMATSGSVAIGEEGKMTAARLQLVASSDDMADKLMRILQGVTAMLSLTETNDAQLTEFLKSVNVERKDTRVSLGLAYPTDRLLQMIRSIHEGAQHGNRGPQLNAGENTPAEPAPTNGIGQVVGEWRADQELGGAAPTAENLTSRTFENVAMKTGATVTVSGRRGGGEHARIDYVEFSPMTGSAGVERYEAEFMRLNHYNIEKLEGASGGEIVRLPDNSGTGTVSFRFQGADGNYRVKVGYVDESDGKSSFALGVQSATAPAGPEAPLPGN